MAIATTINPNNTAQLHVYYEKKLLSTLEPRLVLQPLGKKQKLPKGLGNQVRWLRYDAILGNTTPISEGGPPGETNFVTSNVTATVLQYGQFAKISDLLSDVAIDPVLSNLSERFGIAAAKTIEQLIVAELDAQSSTQFVGAASSNATISLGMVLNHKELVEAMIRQKAALIGPHESGSYVAVLHPNAEYDIMTDVQAGSMLDLRKYTDPKQVLNGEIGKMYGMRFLVSDKMSLYAGVGATGNDVINAAYVIGEEAFGVVELDGNSVKMINKKHGSGGTSDPLDQIATVGYKIHGFAAKYLDNASKRVIKIRAASSL
jgi:N4-gp56 family major capsid protein